MTRNGKIARLPDSIREQLNQRLQDGHVGKSLIDWLSHMPEVQSVLQTHFAGRPINAVNLTEWRQGGFRERLALKKLHTGKREKAFLKSSGRPGNPQPSTLNPQLNHDSPR